MEKKKKSNIIVCVDKHLVCASSQKTVRDQEFEALQGKIQRLEKLRRALKAERNKLSKKVQSLTDDQGGGSGSGTDNPDPETDSPSSPPPPTDSPAGVPCVPAPESDSAPPPQPHQGASGADSDSAAAAPQE